MTIPVSFQPEPSGLCSVRVNASNRNFCNCHFTARCKFSNSNGNCRCPRADTEYASVTLYCNNPPDLKNSSSHRADPLYSQGIQYGKCSLLCSGDGNITFTEGNPVIVTSGTVTSQIAFMPGAFCRNSRFSTPAAVTVPSAATFATLLSEDVQVSMIGTFISSGVYVTFNFYCSY